MKGTVSEVTQTAHSFIQEGLEGSGAERTENANPESLILRPL